MASGKILLLVGFLLSFKADSSSDRFNYVVMKKQTQLENDSLLLGKSFSSMEHNKP